MKEYRIPNLYKGLQFDSIVYSNSINKAANVIGMTTYHLKTYGHVKKKETALKEDTHFVETEYSGETPYIFDKEEIGIIMLYTEFKEKVDNYRKIYKTYKETIEKHER